MIKNYYDSVQKWEDIVTFLWDHVGGVNGEDWKFIHRYLVSLYVYPMEDMPISVIEVVGDCGYCNEFMPALERSCDRCPLAEVKICIEENDSDTVFWKFVDKLKHSEKITVSTIRLAEKVLEAVKWYKHKFRRR